jgi:hypothetical protein
LTYLLREGARVTEADFDRRKRAKSESFAAGHADTATLREVINRLDAASLNLTAS